MDNFITDVDISYCYVDLVVMVSLRAYQLDSLELATIKSSRSMESAKTEWSANTRKRINFKKNTHKSVGIFLIIAIWSVVICKTHAVKYAVIILFNDDLTIRAQLFL